MDSGAPITHLLHQWRAGDAAALEQLTPLVYDELHRIARRYMRGERAGQTLQTTALVNEAYVRLIGGAGVAWQDRAHFYAICAQTMRRILVAAARARGAAKRGGEALRVTFDEGLNTPEDAGLDMVALDDALEELAKIDPRKARVIELRFFAGLTVEEVAEVLGLSEQSVLRDWKLAKAWLARELGK